MRSCLQSGRIRHAAVLHAQCLDHFTGTHSMNTTTGPLSGTAHGIAYTGRWHVDSAHPLALVAVVHMAGRQPVALELGQLSGQVVDVGAALPALHAMVERRALRA